LPHERKLQRITSFTPTSGSIGTTVTITGTNFDLVPANNTVSFNGTIASTPTAVTPTSLTVVVPIGATTGSISVTTPGGTAMSATNFSVITLSSVSYAPKVDYTVGTTPREVAVGDLNNDGNLDIVSSNYGANSISVLMGVGTGCFSLAQSFPAATNAHGLALADVNRDGILDVITTKGSTNSSSLSVLLGTGSGFLPKVDYQTSALPRTPNHMSVYDINQDSWPDLLTANNDPTGSFSILLNNGDGTFSVGVDYPSVNGPTYHVAAADINGDSHPDIAIASFGGTASVYLNDGLGGFPSETTYTSRNGSHFVALKDLNGDSRPEMIIANAVDNSMSVFLNDGVGSFSVPTIYPTGLTPVSFAVDDMNNDGNFDLVIGNAASNTVSVFPGDGNGFFGGSQNFATANGPYSVKTGDFDEDGTIDIVSANLSSNSVSVLLTSGNTCVPAITSFTPGSGPVGTTVTITGTNFSATPANNIVYFGATRASVMGATATQLTVTVPVGATYQPITVQVAGLTGYSAKPFVVTFAGGGNISACSFAPQVDLYTIGSTETGVIGTLVDLDGDGKIDIVMGNNLGNYISVLKNISSPGSLGSSSFATRLDLATGTPAGGTPAPGPVEVYHGDLDGDGKPDLAVTNYTNGYISVFRNTSTLGTISFASRVDFPSGSFVGGGEIYDIDGDGKLDIVFVPFFEGVAVLRNTSTIGVIDGSSFAPRVAFDVGPNPFPFAIGDLDGDGKPEISVANAAGTNTMSIIRNLSTPGSVSFAPKVAFPTDGAVTVSIGDIDGDGKLDLVTNFTSLTVYRNNSTIGSLSFSSTVFGTGVTQYTSALDDLDGDGKIDVVTANYVNNTLSIFKNTSTPGAVSFAIQNNFPANLRPYDMNIGDMDGDGKNDLLTTTYSLSIYRNVIGEISPPTITSFTPASGAIGSTVTITGTNFSTPFSNTVKFNGVTANITASTATTITVDVPAGATTGLIELTIGCNTITSASNFTICSPPAPPSVTNSSGCENTSVALSASGAIGTQEYRWYDVSSGGTSLLSTANFTTPTLSTTTDYYVSIIEPAVSCESARTIVTATINTAPAKPTITSTGPLNFCAGGNITLDAPVGFSSYLWSDGDTNQSRIVATSLTLTLTVTNVSGCQSIDSDPITTNVFALPAKPTITGATSFCTGGSVLLSAPLSSSYLWSDGDTNQTRTISTAVTLTVKVTNSNGCESIDSDPVTTTEVSIPSQPGVTNNSGCSGTSIALNASGGSPGNYRWYSASTGGTAITGFTDDTFTTPSLISSTSYFVAISNGTCESTRTEVIASVLPLPAAPTVSIPASVCSGSSVTLNASGTANGNYRWYDGSTLITGEVNSTFVITNLTANKTYQAAIFDGTCESPKTSVTATIKNCTAPAIASTTATAFIESAVTIDLRTLISDPEDDLDESSLQIVGTLTSGASFTLNGFILTINYTGVPFPGTDKVTISICDQTGLCTQQQLSIELSGTITVYNAVSPNGDDKNEILYIQYIDLLPDTKNNQVFIYNRWGDEVWKTENYNNTTQVFKGLSNAGNELSSGTYYYKIVFNDGSKSKTGFLSLKK
jgi:gliding motility-associated-like protein